MNFSAFFLLLCETAFMLFPLCTLVATFFQLLPNNVLQAILIAPMNEKQAVANATSQTLDVGVHQRLVSH